MKQERISRWTDLFINLREWATKQVRQMDKYKSEGGRGEKQNKGRNEERNARKDDPTERGKVWDKETAAEARRDWWLERKRDMGRYSTRYRRERGRERLNLHTDEVIKQGFYNNWKFKVQNSPPCIALATNLKGGWSSVPLINFFNKSKSKISLMSCA